MIRTKIPAAIFAFILFFGLLSSETYAFEENKYLVTCFYYNPCSSCEEESDITEFIFSLLSEEDNHREISFRMYNTIQTKNQELLKAYHRIYDVPLDKYVANPEIIIIVNDTWLSGYDAVEGYFSGEIKENHNDENKITYFYVEPCEACKKAQKIIDALTGNVIIEKYDISNFDNFELIQAYFIKFEVPQSDQIVPIVFVKEKYLSGAHITQENLIMLVEKEQDNDNEWNNEMDENKDTTTFEFMGVLLTGAVNGLNPCSISMFLFFVSILLAVLKKILKYLLAFIVGKVTAYFLLGTVLYNVFIKIDRNIISDIQVIVKYVLLVSMILLTVLSIMDYFSIKSQKYGHIKLQLPSALRRFNHNAIKKIAEFKNSKLLFPICLILGFIVASGEFLCTGQIYLVTIVYMINRSPEASLDNVLLLLYYILAMMTPLVAISFFVSKGKRIYELSEYIRKKTHLVKLMNALIFGIFAVVILILL
jgi:cytochrome c biogenesis protein CcdA